MKVPYTNRKNHTVHIGGKMITPGATREVDSSQVPRQAPAEPVEQPAHDPVLALLDGTVDEVKAALPDLADDDIRQLRAAEEAGKTRSTLIAAIDETLLERAQGRTGDGSGDGSAPGAGDGSGGGDETPPGEGDDPRTGEG